MSTMTDNDTERYNGYANRETWAFNLHWQNDQGLYNATLDVARENQNGSEDFLLGQAVVAYWDDWLHNYSDHTGEPRLPRELEMFRDEVGSWWRIDYAEVGEAVRESLDAEDGGGGHDA